MPSLSEFERALLAVIRHAENDAVVLSGVAALEWRVANRFDDGASHTIDAHLLAELNRFASAARANADEGEAEAR